MLDCDRAIRIGVLGVRLDSREANLRPRRTAGDGRIVIWTQDIELREEKRCLD